MVGGLNPTGLKSTLRLETPSTQHERADGRVFLKRLDVSEADTKHGLHLGRCAVPQLYPDHLRRVPVEKGPLLEVRVLGYDDEPVPGT